MFAASLAIVSGLWIYRIPAAAVGLDAVTADLVFTPAGDGPVTQPLGLQSLGFTGASKVDFPPDLAIAGAARSDVGSGMQLKLAGAGKGSITLARASVPPGTKVAIHADGGNAFRTAFDSPGGDAYSIEATVEGDLLVGPANGEAQLVFVAAPKLVTITFGGAPAELDFTLSAPTDPALTENLSIASLGLATVETVGAGLAAQQTSGIRSGALTVRDLGNRLTPLAAGSDLSMTLEDGRLRGVGLSGEGIKLHFAGTASAMRGGSGERPVDLMPTALEWLAANQKLALIWGAVIYLFGAALAVGRWWQGGRR
jgi:hypothetical protein